MVEFFSIIFELDQCHRRCAVGAIISTRHHDLFFGIELGTRFELHAFGGRRLIGATVDGLGRGSEVPPEFSRWLRTDGVEKYATAEA